MDKRIKKKLETVNQRLQLARQQLAGAKRQRDEVGEVERLTRLIADLEAEAQKLKTSGGK
jgi:polyhydroxyalkanoate synthesis regulator phasin